MRLKSTSLKLPANIHLKLQQQVIDDGYGMRGKSRWVTEAIEMFFNLPDYPMLADMASEMDCLTDIVSIRLTDTLLTNIDNAVKVIRQEYPLMEGVKSRIIRASIMQRLLRRNFRSPEISVTD